MKASERLRELEPEGLVVTDASNLGYTDAVCLTRATVLLIADVVEAAEVFALRVEEECQNEHTYKLDDALTALRLDDALTALRDALEGDTK